MCACEHWWVQITQSAADEILLEMELIMNLVDPTSEIILDAFAGLEMVVEGDLECIGKCFRSMVRRFWWWWWGCQFCCWDGL